MPFSASASVQVLLWRSSASMSCTIFDLLRGHFRSFISKLRGIEISTRGVLVEAVGQRALH